MSSPACPLPSSFDVAQMGQSQSTAPPSPPPPSLPPSPLTSSTPVADAVGALRLGLRKRIQGVAVEEKRWREAVRRYSELPSPVLWADVREGWTQTRAVCQSPQAVTALLLGSVVGGGAYWGTRRLGGLCLSRVLRVSSGQRVVGTLAGGALIYCSGAVAAHLLHLTTHWTYQRTGTASRDTSSPRPHTRQQLQQGRSPNATALPTPQPPPRSLCSPLGPPLCVPLHCSPCRYPAPLWPFLPPGQRLTAYASSNRRLLHPPSPSHFPSLSVPVPLSSLSPSVLPSWQTPRGGRCRVSIPFLGLPLRLPVPLRPLWLEC